MQSDVATLLNTSALSVVGLNSAVESAPTSVRVDMAETIKRGNRAGVVISGDNSLLNVSLLNSVYVQTYLNETPVQRIPIAQLVGVESSLTSSLRNNLPLFNNRSTRAGFIASGDFNKIELVAGGLVNLSYGIRFYYAFGFDDQNSTIQYKGALSNNASPVEGQEYSTQSRGADGLVCVNVNSNIDNPQNAANTDLTDFATFRNLLSASVLNCPSTLRVKLRSAVGPTDYRAGFVVGNGGLLDLNLFQNVRLSTYLNGALQESASGVNALRLNVLPDNRYFLSFKTTKPFNQVEIRLNGALNILDNLNVYYGFGIEEAAFSDPEPVFSDFEDPADKFRAATLTPNTDGALTVSACASVLGSSCMGFQDPSFAAKRNLTTTYAQIKGSLVNLSVNQGLALAVKLNGANKVATGKAGKAGNRAGFVFDYTGNGGLISNLLSAGVLSNFTITTYREDNSTANKGSNTSAVPSLVAVESVSGANLAQATILGGSTGRQALSFIATQDFDWVELTTTNTVGSVQDTRIYYAFAEELRGFFPENLVNPTNPLPVELAAFTVRATSQGAELHWKTASEKDNSRFVVERAVQQGSEAVFQAIGQVAGSGTTTTAQQYRYLDATAAEQSTGTVYYRLRQVDTNGNESFSPVVAATFEGQTLAVSLQLAPNPAGAAEMVRVLIGSARETTGRQQLVVYDAQGRQVNAVVVTDRTTLLPTQNLGQGLYHVVLLNASGQRLTSQRLIIAGR
ncbi:T9SS type A sorting domain-containing protein [Hymenobacter sp. BT507]|uniref:T9SS type A sorting domain-containing protein n=1 Tax=Hymenobacter citatus TaxID=2763506 RepID=A0ABR7MIW5_9BACT|nr:T9SS type A sorting domain-containing protein [Hymenobacter citatus]MBC6611034.1 T9SS type A sorting domain-containing protein [Hymenobacter citatus]